MKKTFLLFSFFSFIFSLGVTFAYTSEDTSNANYLADQQIVVKQTTASKYRLDDKILRQEVIAMALKIKGITLPENYTCKKYFADVTSSNDWVCRAIEIAADNGIITRSNKYANPGKYVTRAEALAMIYNASGMTPGEMGIITYGDKDIVTWQKQIFMKIYGAGLPIPGMKKILSSDESEITLYFYPNRLATRAEVFAFAKNIIGITTDSTGVSYEIKKYTHEDYPAQKLYLMKNGSPYLVKNTMGIGDISDVNIIGNLLVYTYSYEGSAIKIFNTTSLQEVETIYEGYLSADKKSIIACSAGGFGPGNVSIFSLINNDFIFDLKNDILNGNDYDSVVSCIKETENNRLNFYISTGSEESEIIEGYYVNMANGNITQKPKYLNILTQYYYHLNYRAFNKAHSMRSPAGVSLATFESWYKNTQSVTFREDTLQDLDPPGYTLPHVYEFLVDMTENGKKSTYKVKSKVNLEKFTIDNISSVKQ